LGALAPGALAPAFAGSFLTFSSAVPEQIAAATKTTANRQIKARMAFLHSLDRDTGEQ
jgi:hypothetical protein